MHTSPSSSLRLSAGIRIHRLVPVLILLLVTALPGNADARKWYVNTAGTGDAPTIQAAIDSSFHGDDVLVDQGAYFENIRFHGKAITVKSLLGADLTFIDGGALTAGSDSGSVVNMGSQTGTGSFLDGFTIQNGTGTLISGYRWGGGILCESPNPQPTDLALATIVNCVVTGNTARFGAGIGAATVTDGLIETSTIQGNTAVGSNAKGGGVWFNQTGPNWRMSFCVVAENISGGYGGGIQFDIPTLGDGVGPIVDHCTIVNNEVLPGGLGGGFSCSPTSRPLIQNSIVAGSVGLGVYCAENPGWAANPQIACSDFFGNDGGDWQPGMPQYMRRWGSTGTGDSQFNSPWDVAVGPDGSVYVVDGANNTVQKFTEDGAFIQKWGSFGTGPGQFDACHAVTVDDDGYVYVVEWGNSRVQKFTADSVFVTQWGSAGSADGQFSYPTGIAVDDASGHVYVVDSGNRRVQKFTDTGTHVLTWGSNGSAPGQFNQPRGIEVAADGNVYVADTWNHRVQKFTANGAFRMEWGTQGSGDGQFDYPWDVVIDPLDEVYVLDSGNDRIQKFETDGEYLGEFGGPGYLPGHFLSGVGLACGGAGVLYVTDISADWVQKFQVCGTDLAGNFVEDPLFCDELAGNFSLLGASLCLPYLRPGRDCWDDLVGAKPYGCASAPCYPSLPDPILGQGVLEPHLEDPDYVVFNFPILNMHRYPDSLFVLAPELPECGLLDPAPRSYVQFFDQNDDYLYGHCNVTAPGDTLWMWFHWPSDQPPPDSTYVKILDRRCDIEYRSNTVALRDVVAVPDEVIRPRLRLLQNHPNPVRLGTTFSLTLPEASRVRLNVYDLAGRLVSRVVDRPLAAGPHEIPWPATDLAGRRLAPGVYFYKLKAAEETLTRKMVLLK